MAHRPADPGCRHHLIAALVAAERNSATSRGGPASARRTSPSISAVCRTVTAMATNPLESSSYQEREYFTDEYERLALAARNWQIAFLIAGGTALIAVAALGWLATHSRLIPYVVNVDRQGYALAAPGALVEAEPFAGQDRPLHYDLTRFIRAARGVIGDPLAQAAAIDRVRARTGDTAGRRLKPQGPGHGKRGGPGPDVPPAA